MTPALFFYAQKLLFGPRFYFGACIRSTTLPCPSFEIIAL